MTAQERFHPTRIDLWTDPISPHRRPASAGLHAADTLACMHRFSHMLRWPPKPAVCFMSAWRVVEIKQARTYADLPIISSSFEMALDVKRVNQSVGQSVLMFKISFILECSTTAYTFSTPQTLGLVTLQRKLQKFYIFPEVCKQI